MSKQNNLKDYLTDLYDGISSKKPDASRNPQNFRAEIEAIKTGGIPWDGDYTIEGDALPEPPKAYHPTSVDELPTDAVDGSLAVVKASDGIVGTWLLNWLLSNQGLEQFAYPDGSFHIEVNGYVTANEISHFTYLYGDWDAFGALISVWVADDDAGVDLPLYENNYKGVTSITIEGEPDPAEYYDFLYAFLNVNGRKAYTLYSRENGKWVNKGEI